MKRLVFLVSILLFSLLVASQGLDLVKSRALPPAIPVVSPDELATASLVHTFDDLGGIERFSEFCDDSDRLEARLRIALEAIEPPKLCAPLDELLLQCDDPGKACELLADGKACSTSSSVFTNACVDYWKGKKPSAVQLEGIVNEACQSSGEVNAFITACKQGEPFFGTRFTGDLSALEKECSAAGFVYRVENIGGKQVGYCEEKAGAVVSGGAAAPSGGGVTAGGGATSGGSAGGGSGAGGASSGTSSGAGSGGSGSGGGGSGGTSSSGGGPPLVSCPVINASAIAVFASTCKGTIQQVDVNGCFVLQCNSSTSQTINKSQQPQSQVQPTVSTPCIDSDNNTGNTQMVAGNVAIYVNGATLVYNDTCVPGQAAVTEYSCTADGVVTSANITCTGKDGNSQDNPMCSNGACKAAYYNPPFCTDSDGGFNLAVKGHLEASQGNAISTRDDQCSGGFNVGGNITEYSCKFSSTGFVTFPDQSLACPDGMFCMKGACFSTADAACVDTDGGQDFLVNGSVNVSSHGVFVAFSDICHNNTHIKEKYCDGSTGIKQNFTACPAGTGCLNGACVSTAAGSCVESASGVLVTYENGSSASFTNVCDTTVSSVTYYACTSPVNTTPSSSFYNCPISACINGKCTTYSCSDDDGQNYDLRGNTTLTAANSAETRVFQDRCHNSSAVFEYYCPASWRVEYSIANCAYGCTEGTCNTLSSQGGCFDSDGGQNASLKGNLTIYSPGGQVVDIKEDYCYNETAVAERYCTGTGANNAGKTISCPQGTTCQNGACKPIATNGQCIDTDNGQNATVKGNTSKLSAQGQVTEFREDSCKNATQVEEWYCSPSYIYNISLPCPGGKLCHNGVCQSNVKCIDSEVGQNASIRGTVAILYKNASISFTPDSCAAGAIKDYYCFDSNSPTLLSKSISCPAGKTCSNGTCASLSCTDSDSGKVTHIAGYVNSTSGSGFTLTGDSCYNSTAVREYYCTASNSTGMKIFPCSAVPNGACSNTSVNVSSGYSVNASRCTYPAWSCFETDNGNAPNIGGNATYISEYGSLVEKQDYCINSTRLVEFECISTSGSSPQQREINCPQGWTCSNSTRSCVSTTANAPVFSCVDSDAFTTTSKGFVTISSTTNGLTSVVKNVTDQCWNTTIVKEHYCAGSSSSEVSYEIIPCAAGFTCSNGVCPSTLSTAPARVSALVTSPASAFAVIPPQKTDGEVDESKCTKETYVQHCKAQLRAQAYASYSDAFVEEECKRENNENKILYTKFCAKPDAFSECKKHVENTCSSAKEAKGKCLELARNKEHVVQLLKEVVLNKCTAKKLASKLSQLALEIPTLKEKVSQRSAFIVTGQEANVEKAAVQVETATRRNLFDSFLQFFCLQYSREKQDAGKLQQAASGINASISTLKQMCEPLADYKEQCEEFLQLLSREEEQTAITALEKEKNAPGICSLIPVTP